MELRDNRLLLGVLGAVIAVALVVALVGFRSDSTAPAPPPGPEEQTLSFLCGKCGGAFDQPQKAIPAETYQNLLAARPAAVDCPKCGDKACAYPPTRCPACGHQYISEQSRGVAPPPGKGIRCPKCQVDPVEHHLRTVKPEV